MKIAIRADASAVIGTGHMKRCITLGRELEAMGATVIYVTRKIDQASTSVLADEANIGWLPAFADEFLSHQSLVPHVNWSPVSWDEDSSQTVAELTDFNPTWVIVDHYAFDALWHVKVRESLSCKIMVIDDLADRDLVSDLLLDANYASDHELKYRNHLVSSSRTCFGPRFALLDPIYRTSPPYEFHPQVASIGIFMGGADSAGLSERALEICRDSVGFIGKIEVVTTSANPNLTRLAKICGAISNTSLLVDLPNLAEFFSRHDLQIGAGGSASWERCCVGVPSISVVAAPNQLAVTPALEAIGVTIAASVSEDEIVLADKSIARLEHVLIELLSDPSKRLKLGTNAKSLVDGFGARRAAVCLHRGDMHIRPATIDHAEMLFRWRNHPSTRKASLDTAELAYTQHLAWLERSLAAKTDRFLFVAMLGTLAVGSIRFDRISELVFEVSLYLDPDLHGLGLGQEMLIAGETQMLAVQQQPFRIDATVLPENVTSASMFSRCGYTGAPPRYSKNVCAE